LQSLSFLGYPEILFQFIVMEVLPLKSPLGSGA